MNRKTFVFVTAGLAAFIVLAGLVAAFGNRAGSQTGKIKVVAAENFWGNIASQIAGGHAEVSSVISDPEADPHLYESGAKDASAITGADIVIVNGLGYDDFVQKIIDTSTNKNRAVISAASVLHANSGDNPHLWYDIGRIGLMAAEIQKQLIAKDPANKPAYDANFTTFMTSLHPLYDRLDTIRKDFLQAPVAYTERVPGYVLAQAGLTLMTPPTFASAIEDGNEPSVADQNAMLALIATKKIRALLYNAQASSPVTEHIRDVARQNGIPVVGVTETLPQNYQTYQEWQQAQLDTLTKALENTR